MVQLPFASSRNHGTGKTNGSSTIEAAMDMALRLSRRRTHTKQGTRSTVTGDNTPDWEHFVRIYIDDNGDLKVKTSPSLHDQKHDIILDAYKWFQQIFEPSSRPVNSSFQDPFVDGSKDSTYFQPALKTEGLEVNVNRTRVPRQELARAPKRRLSSVSDTLSDSESENGIEEDVSPAPVNHDTKTMQIGDREAVHKYYHEALTDFQQIHCRTVTKKLIQVIEPRKQVNHPYNGRCKSKDRKEVEKASTTTKPDWWPPWLRHKEPDHIVKQERIQLMQYIIENSSTPLLNNVTVDQLRDHARTAKGSVKPKKWLILEEIFRVRAQQERFEADEIDATTNVYVVDRSSIARTSRKAKRSKQADDFNKKRAKQLESHTTARLTPTSPSVESSQRGIYVDTKQSVTEMGQDASVLYEDINSGFREYQPSSKYQPSLANEHYVDTSSETYNNSTRSSAPSNTLLQEHSPTLFIGQETYNQRTLEQFQSSSTHTQAQPAMWPPLTPHQLQSMEHYPTSVPPELCQPGLYGGQPSQLPRMQALCSEQAVFDHIPYQNLHIENDQSIAHGLFMIDNQQFSRSKDMRQPKSLPFRSLNANQYPLMNQDNPPLIMGQEPFYQYASS